jgi:thiol-disulfide isomerase/thioredoxin
VFLSGCAANNGSKQNAHDGTGVVRISPARRHSPVVLSGTTLAGTSLSTSNIHGVIVVNAWASWCRNCIFEWRDLQRVSNSHINVAFLGLDESDSKQTATKFLAAHPTSYQHIFDPDNAILNRIKDVSSVAIPTTLVLDKQHRVAARIVGRINSEELENIVSDLLAE